MELTEPKLSPDFTDKVMEKIFENHCKNAFVIGAKHRGSGVTSGADFLLPFSYTVVHGLCSGEMRQGVISKLLRLKSCYALGDDVYQTRENPITPEGVGSAISDLFDVSYALGKSFSRVRDFRDANRRVSYLAPERGAEFVLSMAEGFSVCKNRGDFSGRVWANYASGFSPRLGF